MDQSPAMTVEYDIEGEPVSKCVHKQSNQQM